MTDIWSTTSVSHSGIDRGSPAADALRNRTGILRMTQEAEDAVLRPKTPGRWPHALRAALASRIARLNNCVELGDIYGAGAIATKYEGVSDPALSAKITDIPLANIDVCLTFVDRVASRPRDITPEDISILQEAGISDADIVRLTELVAFMGYQVRLAMGLKLLAGEPS